MVNFCLDEYCNIGYMEGMADALNSIRGFNMSCQIVVQSLSQWQEKYPGKEWENQLATFDQTLYMGCNDMTSAKYISEKCGKITIAVTNNQMPLAPLFSPIYSTTRPYSQTKSNTQRDLMLPDEILRLDRDKCIVLFQGHKPALLYKLSPESIPAYAQLRPRRIIDYMPEWKREEAVSDRQVIQEESKPKEISQREAFESNKNDCASLPSDDYDYDFSNIESIVQDLGDKVLSEADINDVLGMEGDVETE
jgi:type IV secretion system protein VirD4